MLKTSSHVTTLLVCKLCGVHCFVTASFQQETAKRKGHRSGDLFNQYYYDTENR